MAMAVEDREVESKPKRTRKKAEQQVEQAKTNGNGRTMSEEHKEALAIGREQGRIVKSYLEALFAHKPKRGRKRSPEAIENRLVAIEQEYPTASALDRLHLAQEKLDLEAELAVADEEFDISDLEVMFISVAAEYSNRKGLTRAAWREIGVPPAVLTAAGIR